MFHVRYEASVPTCKYGQLIPKRRAPLCFNCGRILWTPYRLATHNARGERLGFVPRLANDNQPRCWNGKQCRKRVAIAYGD